MDGDKATEICNEMLEKLENSAPPPSDFSIFRVPDLLRKVNEECYEPQVVSIGPYHRGKSHLQRMEGYKIQFLMRKGGKTDELKSYVLAMGALEESARKCYGETIGLGSDEFVKMMILDACFIVEIMRCRITGLEQKGDPKFAIQVYLSSINRDMFLLENQIPFFVLLEFFNLAKMPKHTFEFIHMIAPFLMCKFQGLQVEYSKCDPYTSKHLLDFVHTHWFPTWTRSPEPKPRELIHCAKELREAGIVFKRVDRVSVFDVRFKQGKLEIPTLGIEEETETILRNMIAFEQILSYQVCYVSDYMKLMDCLIDCKKDVQLLRKSGIFDNRLGDDDAIVSIFNKLGLYVIPGNPGFLYSHLFQQVNQHCIKKHNKWMANLRHDYFHSPWALISFFAALAFLLLTFIQTIYTVLSSYQTP